MKIGKLYVFYIIYYYLIFPEKDPFLKNIIQIKTYLGQCCDFSKDFNEQIRMSMLEDDLLDGVVSVVQAVPNLEHRPEAALGKEAAVKQNIFSKN